MNRSEGDPKFREGDKVIWNGEEVTVLRTMTPYSVFRDRGPTACVIAAVASSPPTRWS